MFDAIIIGAGYGSMGVAALLARSGLKIIVIEQSSLIGGSETWQHAMPS
jgi:all-trans-retinol 13,14-reductase